MPLPPAVPGLSPLLLALPAVVAGPNAGCMAGGGAAALGGVFLLASLVFIEHLRARARRRRREDPQLDL